MRSPIVLLILLALVPVLGARPAHAQDPVDRVRIDIEITDQRIQRAEILVAENDNELARRELALAVSIQAQAKIEFAAGHYRIAHDLTLRARGRADRAIALIQGLPDPDRVAAQLERTRELLDRARERIEECGIDRARAILHAALDMQARAEIAARDGRYLAALQLTMAARERAHRALRLCHMEENLRESAERALRRTDDVIGRARDVVAEAGSEPARAALARAIEQQERAHAEFRAEHYEASLRFTLHARTQALRAIRLAGAG